MLEQLFAEIAETVSLYAFLQQNMANNFVITHSRTEIDLLGLLNMTYNHPMRIILAPVSANLTID